MTEKCIIWGNDAVSDRCDIDEKGIKVLIKASDGIKGRKHELLQGRKMLFFMLPTETVYSFKQTNFLKPRIIARDLKVVPSEQQPGTSRSDPCLRSNQIQFDFKIKFLLCSETSDDQFQATQSKRYLDKRRLVYSVRTTNFDESLSPRANDRKHGRGDESALQGTYVHRTRYLTMIVTKNLFIATALTGRKRCPKGDAASESMEETQLDKKDDCQYALDELMVLISG